MQIQTAPDTLVTILNAYRKRRKLTLADLAGVLGVSTASAGRYVLPPTNPNHKRPNREAAQKLREWSFGFVDAANYADPWTPDVDARWVEVGAFGEADASPESERAPAPAAEGAR